MFVKSVDTKQLTKTILKIMQSFTLERKSVITRPPETRTSILRSDFLVASVITRHTVRPISDDTASYTLERSHLPVTNVITGHLISIISVITC